MAKRIPYKSLDLKTPARVVKGRAKSTSVTSVDGLRLVRVIDDGRDDVLVEGADAWPGTEIPWANVAAAVRETEK